MTTEQKIIGANPERHNYELCLATKTKSRAPMASASASTRRSATSSIGSPSARRCLAQSRSADRSPCLDWKPIT